MYFVFCPPFKRMRRIDLHIHSAFSDGTLTPAQIVSLAREEGLCAIGVTDHDTVAGLEEAEREGREQDIEVVPGVEISTSFKHGTLHLLGYFLKYKKREFTEVLGDLQESRKRRTPQMAAMLRKLGFDIDEEEVFELAGGGQVGRPHFAELMVRKGYVKDPIEAFDRFLGEGRPGYVERTKPAPEKGMEILTLAEAFPVLAHPATLELPEEGLKDQITILMERGLKGIEAFYPLHSREGTRRILRLAGHFGLAVTGGSDFHGPERLRYPLGKGTANLPIPYVLLEKLKEKREGGD